MEMQFGSGPCSFLRCNVREIQNQEQTLELRLTEQMPDIGKVLCAWGQVLLRSKEWLSDSVRVTGGINAWVVYLPEDGSVPRCVEGWLPFQSKWLLPDGHREGSVRIQALLRTVDARSLSARKMMVRASVGLLAEVLEPQEASVFTPDVLPEDVQVLRKRYPVSMMREAGEKLFTLEEDISPSGQRPSKLLSYRVWPEISEQAVAGGRVIMRGAVVLQYVYLGDDERIYSNSQDIPFAQFTELDMDYDKEAIADILPQMANLECTLIDDRLQVKCGVIAQYVVSDRVMLDVAEDVYSLNRKVSPTVMALELPVSLDTVTQSVNAEVEIPVDAESVVDVAFRPDHPVQYRQEDGIRMEIPGVFQMLYYDTDGNLQSGTVNWSGQTAIPAGEDCNFCITMEQPRPAMGAVYADRIRANGDLTLNIRTGANQTIPMITALELGDAITPDPMRPSVVVRRAGDQSLWTLAKNCGSTVEAIQQANALTDEPAPDKMLLIPVI